MSIPTCLEIHHVNDESQDFAGPNLFEIEYLKNLKQELKIFLETKGLSTIQEISIQFKGPHYTGVLKVG